MRLRLLDILACPCDGASPLKLISLSAEQRSARNLNTAPPCTYYCAYEDKPVRSEDSASSLPSRQVGCATCHQEDVIEGVLLCPSCRRWFSILDGIPLLVRDGLRREDVEIAFLRRNADRLPEEITSEGKPINLRSHSIERTEPRGDGISASLQQDTDILDEGEYWGEFFAVHDAVGDSSILDIRQKAKHPSYYPYGVLEPDERDRERDYGMFPNHVGQLLFGALGRFRGGRALDIGCGGGQLALEAAQQGLDAVGMDVSLCCLEIARRYAASIQMDVQYVYAEPMNPPFRRDPDRVGAGTFDLLLSKDTLHHLPDPEGALVQLAAVLKREGAILVYEHVAKSRLVRWLVETFNRLLVPKIQRRYQNVDVPEILLTGSANEDLGMKRVVPAIRKLFVPEFQYGELMLYFEMEQLFYYAFGKRVWLSRLVRDLFFIVEKVLLLFIPPQHVTMLARKPACSADRRTP